MLVVTHLASADVRGGSRRDERERMDLITQKK